MICWDSHDDTIIGYFSPRQIQWLRKQVSTLRNELQIEVAGWEYQCYPDAMMGTILVADDGLRLIRRRVNDAALLLHTLPDSGGLVILPNQRCVYAWVWSLAECRINLARRLGLEQQLPQLVNNGARSDADRARRTLSGVITWLNRVVDSLVDVASLPGQLLPPDGTCSIDMR